ncbi:MAG: hypothetical protein M1821_009273 [Bathelium mastoideum]|nr:MAG: hypothetical protein M1821_009273 [Bathelium mastoideum]
MTPAKTRFEVHRALCYAFLPFVKFMDYDGSTMRDLFFYHAWQQEQISMNAENPAIDMLGRIRGETPVAVTNGNNDLLRQCVRAGLCQYVDTSLKRTPSLNKWQNKGLLDCVLRCNKYVDQKAQLQMVYTLLNHGVDPNEECQAATVWHLLLMRVGLLHGTTDNLPAVRLSSIEDFDFVTALLSLFLRFKADVNLYNCLEALLIENRTGAIWGQEWRYHRLDILKAFFDHGATPNLLGFHSNFTIWEIFLHHVYNDEHRKSDYQIALCHQKIELMIKAGADLDICLYYKQGWRANRCTYAIMEPRPSLRKKIFQSRLHRYTISDVIWACFPEQQARHLLELVDQQKKKRFLNDRWHAVGKLRSSSGRSSLQNSTTDPVR